MRFVRPWIVVPLVLCFVIPAVAVELVRPTADSGGTSSGGTLQLTGTIGQPDAGVASGGTLELFGGVWSGQPVATSVDNVPTPYVNQLEGAHPNPFNPATTLRFQLAKEGQATVRIYSIAGRLVRELLAEPLAAGPHDVTWNGRDDQGQSVASGVYLVQMRAPGFAAAKKITLVK